MFARLSRIALIILPLGLVAGCAGRNPVLAEPMLLSEMWGFWGGLINGFVLPISFLASLVTDAISIYAVTNTGGSYDFGFVLGLLLLYGVIQLMAKS